MAVYISERYSIDLNEIGISECSPRIEHDMRCPQVGTVAEGNNWSVAQCVLRVRLNNPCTARCSYGRSLRAKMESEWEGFELEPFPGVPVGCKKKEEPPAPDPNEKWPGKHKKRNINLTREILSGRGVREVSDAYGLGVASACRICSQYAAVACAGLFDTHTAKQGSRLEFMRLNRDRILPHLVFLERV